MKQYGRVDANHGEVVKALEAVGCSVMSLAPLGGGKPDLLACRIQRGGGVRYFLFEVKVEKRKLRPAQVQFAKDWPDVVHVVRSAAEAVRIVLEGA